MRFGRFSLKLSFLLAVGVLSILLGVGCLFMMADEWSTGQAVARGRDILREEGTARFHAEMAWQGIGCLVTFGVGVLFIWGSLGSVRMQRDIAARLNARPRFDDSRRAGVAPTAHLEARPQTAPQPALTRPSPKANLKA